MSESYFADYQKSFLERERDCLALSSQGGCFQLKSWRTFSFRCDGNIRELEELFLRVMKSINAHLEDYPPPDINYEFDEYKRIGEFWINEFPKQFVDKFLPLMTEPPKPEERSTVDYSAMSKKELAAYFKKEAQKPEGKPGDLVFSLELYTLAERYWFYQNHFIDGNRIKIGVDCSEDPCPTYSLIELVEFCGGVYVEHGYSEGKSKGFWSSLLDKLKGHAWLSD